jgi:NAD kinase
MLQSKSGHGPSHVAPIFHRIRKVLSNNITHKDTKADTAGWREVVVDGTRYCAVNVVHFYTISSMHRTMAFGSLIDRGAQWWYCR